MCTLWANVDAVPQTDTIFPKARGVKWTFHISISVQYAVTGSGGTRWSFVATFVFFLVEMKSISSWHWTAFTRSDAIMQFQRKTIQKLFIWDKLSEAINSGLLRVIALKLRKIY